MTAVTHERPPVVSRRQALPPGKTPPEVLDAELTRLPRDITAVLEDLIIDRGIQKQDLAKRMGVSAGRVSQILSGDENLTLRTVATVLAALGVHFGDIPVVDNDADEDGGPETPGRRSAA